MCMTSGSLRDAKPADGNALRTPICASNRLEVRAQNDGHRVPIAVPRIPVPSDRQAWGA